MSRSEQLYPREANSRWRDYEWEIIPSTPLPPAMNIALDEVLTRQVGAGARRPTLRFWGWAAPVVVIGRFQSVRNEVQIENSADLGVQIVRRITGGGAMFTEPGLDITYSLYAPPALVEGLSFPESYAFLDSWVVETFRELGIDAWYAPLNDITSAGGKIGGAAQARRFGAVLHHTMASYEMDPTLMLQVLRIGMEKLSDKGLRSADKRVGPLHQQTNLPREAFFHALTERFKDLTGGELGEITDVEHQAAVELVRAKFSTEEWTYLLP
ncbi:MAG TPA: biotin/lipoate A/B protein ligase family protein [Thermomicrobiales bacterium]|nr:biotin/lipoate A/B protein ligase family protein [Thermomicrobiales bacterium]